MRKCYGTLMFKETSKICMGCPSFKKCKEKIKELEEKVIDYTVKLIEEDESFKKTPL